MADSVALKSDLKLKRAELATVSESVHALDKFIQHKEHERSKLAVLMQADLAKWKNKSTALAKERAELLARIEKINEEITGLDKLIVDFSNPQVDAIDKLLARAKPQLETRKEEIKSLQESIKRIEAQLGSGSTSDLDDIEAMALMFMRTEAQATTQAAQATQATQVVPSSIPASQPAEPVDNKRAKVAATEDPDATDIEDVANEELIVEEASAPEDTEETEVTPKPKKRKVAPKRSIFVPESSEEESESESDDDEDNDDEKSQGDVFDFKTDETPFTFKGKKFTYVRKATSNSIDGAPVYKVSVETSLLTELRSEFYAAAGQRPARGVGISRVDRFWSHFEKEKTIDSLKSIKDILIIAHPASIKSAKKCHLCQGPFFEEDALCAYGFRNDNWKDTCDTHRYHLPCAAALKSFQIGLKGQAAAKFCCVGMAKVPDKPNLYGQRASCYTVSQLGKSRKSETEAKSPAAKTTTSSKKSKPKVSKESGSSKKKKGEPESQESSSSEDDDEEEQEESEANI